MGAENPSSFDEFFQSPGKGEQRWLQRADPYQLYSRLNDLALMKDALPRTPEQQRAMYKVRKAFGVLSYPYLEDWQQETIQLNTEIDRQLGFRRVKLTPFERGILVKVASLAGIPCNPQQRRYSFASLPRVPWVRLPENWKR